MGFAVLFSDHLLPCLQCSTMLVVYQRSCGSSTCVGTSRRLRGLHWGELAADFVAPKGWIPIDGLVRLSYLTQT